MSYKLISEYFSENEKRRAIVSQDLTNKQFRVAVVSDTGTSFSSMFTLEEDAELFAEDWVKPL